MGIPSPYILKQPTYIHPDHCKAGCNGSQVDHQAHTIQVHHLLQIWQVQYGSRPSVMNSMEQGHQAGHSASYYYSCGRRPSGPNGSVCM